MNSGNHEPLCLIEYNGALFQVAADPDYRLIKFASDHPSVTTFDLQLCTVNFRGKSDNIAESRENDSAKIHWQRFNFYFD